jgi:hypothetical protein
MSTTKIHWPSAVGYFKHPVHKPLTPTRAIKAYQANVIDIIPNVGCIIVQADNFKVLPARHAPRHRQDRRKLEPVRILQRGVGDGDDKGLGIGPAEVELHGGQVHDAPVLVRPETRVREPGSGPIHATSANVNLLAKFGRPSLDRSGITHTSQQSWRA